MTRSTLTAAAAVSTLDLYGDPVLHVRSCSGWWFFNLQRSTFCIADPGTDPAFVTPSTWQPFVALQLSDDDPGFRVVLDADGQRGLWAQRCEGDCPRCAPPDRP